MKNGNEFIDFFNYLVENCKEPVEIPDSVQEVLDFLGAQKERPLLTESGLQILEYLQKVNAKNLKASDIATGMGISSRKVSGAIRKLVSDNFVQKFGKTPVIYNLTEQGKTFDIEKYKETLENEEDN